MKNVSNLFNRKLLGAVASALIVGTASTAQAKVVRTCMLRVATTYSIQGITPFSVSEGSAGAGYTVLAARRDSAKNTINDFTPKVRDFTKTYVNLFGDTMKIGEYVTVKGTVFGNSGHGCSGTIGPFKSPVKMPGMGELRKKR